MSESNNNPFQGHQRIIQEFVPGKQVTLAHVIANPDSSLASKIGLVGDHGGSMGVLTITPGEGAIIAADLASKAAGIQLSFVDRFSGSLVITGSLSDVESGVESIVKGLHEILGFTPTSITRT